MKTLKWTKPKSNTFLGPNSSNLRYGGKVIAVAQQLKGGDWFWCTWDYELLPRINTSHEPCRSLEEAQAKANAFVATALERNVGKTADV